MMFTDVPRYPVATQRTPATTPTNICLCKLHRQTYTSTGSTGVNGSYFEMGDLEQCARPLSDSAERLEPRTIS